MINSGNLSQNIIWVEKILVNFLDKFIAGIKKFLVFFFFTLTKRLRAGKVE